MVPWYTHFLISHSENTFNGKIKTRIYGITLLAVCLGDKDIFYIVDQKEADDIEETVTFYFYINYKCNYKNVA